MNDTGEWARVEDRPSRSGDVIITCSLCGQSYYLVHGHVCEGAAAMSDKGEWIRVENQLPPELELVLFWGREWAEETCVGYMQRGKWFDIDFPEDEEVDVNMVTHWMHKPDPPEVDDE